MCYYTGFPIVRVRDDAVSGWHNEIKGARALAVGGSRVALFGGYGPERNRLAVGVLDGDRLHLTGEYRLVLPGGQPLPTGVQVVGRGSDLHFIHDHWWRLTIDDIPSAQ